MKNKREILKEFDDKFNRLGWGDYECTRYSFSDIITPADIKRFIILKLKEQKKEIVKTLQIKKRKNNVKRSGYKLTSKFNENYGYNKAVDDFNENKSKLEDEKARPRI